MKKALSLLMAAMMLPLAMGAQALVPARIDLQPNQKLMGHYTTDDIALGGCWGMSLLAGVTPIGTDITPEELVVFQGSEIVAFRVGLSTATPVTRVFVIPVAPDGTLGEETEWTCQAGDEGWNLIELATPYLINLPDDYSLRIGFDYEQQRSSQHKPISAVMVGDIYPSMCVYKGQWRNYGINTKGNLSIQCITQNDNYPQYILRVVNLNGTKNLKVGDDISFSFQARNLGVGDIDPGDFTFDVAIDGTVVKTISNSKPLTDQFITIHDVVPSDGLSGGLHTLSVTTASLKGEAIEEPITLSYTFNCFEFGFSRQMRLVEQFTSTYCRHCPKGTACLEALSEMRGDIAWVSIHQDMSGTDVFRTIQCDSIKNLEHIDGFPEGSFDRTIGVDPEDPSLVWTVLSYNDAQYGANVFNYFLNSITEIPSWATVYINSTYDAQARKASITINGDLVPNYEEYMGNDSKLTVYITEDNLVAPQYDNDRWVDDYVHNDVLRKALVSVKGVALNKSGDTYKNEFTVDIPQAWNSDNLNIVAFISRPLGNPVNDIYVTNANKRKLGEFDAPTTLPGDVNMDGEVSIADAAQLIDYLLDDSVTPFSTEGADCNGDGVVDIEDAALIIDYLLAGEWNR